ncbi:MAG: phosphoglucosamine mutase [Clostridia bacterium]|nr:phosphoglucosamine mutase [Clostridia bacterium]
MSKINELIHFSNLELKTKFPSCEFFGKNLIAETTKIYDSVIEDCTIGENVYIYQSVLKKCNIESGSIIAPLTQIDNTITKKFFGTDGIRGIFEQDLTKQLIKNVAKSLCFDKSPKIVFGMDTRDSGKEISKIFFSEAKKYGAEIINLGIIPTACVSFYTKQLKADFGVVISASHNPKEYNGIKVLDKTGIKLSEKQELNLEKLFDKNIIREKTREGRVINSKSFNKEYIDLIKNIDSNVFDKIKIVLDCSNGASSVIAPEIFNQLYAEVIAINTKGDINEKCGALYPEVLVNEVIKNKADLGFSFDGDADRVIAVNKNGEKLDGDEILYVLSWYYKKNNILKNNTVVGTVLTNIGIENKLKALGVDLKRTQVGDKYIIEEMQKNNYILGGEQAGHIILKNYIPSSDGILTARILTSVYLENKNIFNTVKENKYVQISKNINLLNNNDKNILNNSQISNLISFYQNKLGSLGKIIVRASGTEPKIRIMVETTDKNISNLYCLEIKKRITNYIKYIKNNKIN